MIISINYPPRHPEQIFLQVQVLSIIINSNSCSSTIAVQGFLIYFPEHTLIKNLLISHTIHPDFSLCFLAFFLDLLLLHFPLEMNRLPK